MGTADWRGGDLYIEIKNCMNLSITSAFHAWRINFSSLYLIIENAENVNQEEVPSELSHVGRDSLLFRSDFISTFLKPPLIILIAANCFVLFVTFRFFVEALKNGSNFTLSYLKY